MTEIGGNAPLFLEGFARECLAQGGDAQEITVDTIAELQPFQAHRFTVVDLACKEDAASYYSGDHRERQNVEVKFGDFVDYFRASSRGDEHWLDAVEGLQFYLCQCPIAVYKPDEVSAEPVLPEIMQLFRIPAALSTVNVSQVNLWMAVKPSRTGIHYDAYRNVLVVLHGEKTVKLYPPSQTKYLYPRPIYSRSANHSSVNFVDPDLSVHPDFVHSAPIVMNVAAGNAVYIPEGWWHQVDSAPFTIAINLWFDGLRDQLVGNPDMSVYYARVIMEDLVRVETARTIRQLHNEKRAAVGTSPPASVSTIASPLNTTQDRESMLLSISEDDMVHTQIALASQFPLIWKELLMHSSVEFAAFLTDFWDRAADGETWIPSLFAVFGEHADEIKHELMAKHERFKQKVCSQVLLATFAN